MCDPGGWLPTAGGDCWWRSRSLRHVYRMYTCIGGVNISSWTLNVFFLEFLIFDSKVVFRSNVAGTLIICIVRSITDLTNGWGVIP